jgi:uncharacterized protein YegL
MKSTRETLTNLLEQYGVELIENFRQLGGLLNDLCGNSKGEIFIILAAAREHVPSDLLASRINYEIILPRLQARLMNNLLVSSEAALWAVETWALALGVVRFATTSENLHAEQRRQVNWSNNYELHVFWLLDASSSMLIDGKIQALNYAIQNLIPDFQKVADEKPDISVYITAIRFSDVATNHIGPVMLKDFRWVDLSAFGDKKNWGAAIDLLSLYIKELPENIIPPLIILVSDGSPTDNFKEALGKFLSTREGERTTRIAIAIGDACDITSMMLFTGNNRKAILQANNSEALVRFIEW